MNSENNKSEMDLIAKYLAGEATTEEAMSLDVWLTEPGNKKIFDQAVKLYNHLPGPVALVPPLQHEWSQLQQKIKERQPKLFRMRLLRYASAACFVGIIAFISFIVISDGKNHTEEKIDLAMTKLGAGNEVKKEIMPDGSTITINKNSSVSYSKLFNNVNREVHLAGESYFNIIPDKSRPFIISFDDVKIKVVGTSFNVREIPADKSIEVQVASGIVKMYTAEKEITVVRGQTGLYTPHNHDLKLSNNLDINSFGYATKTFSFTDVSLAEVCHYLEKAFNVTIELDVEKFADCRLTAQFQDKTLHYIMDVINATLNTTYKQHLNTIKINGKGCQ